MFILNHRNGIHYYTSDLFPATVSHAFTTRLGGNAPPPLDEFSLGTAQYKQHYENIRENRQKLCKLLNMPFEHLLMADQKHTDNITVITTKTISEEGTYIPDTDALITKETGIPLLLFFADCTPILLYDTENHVLGVVHAGWKGVAQKIAAKTVDKMVSDLNANKETIIAAIGPNIGSCCFEVGKDVGEEIIKTVSPKSISDKMFLEKEDKAFVDLKAINVIQLNDVGVQTVDVSQECTACTQEMFFSHRMTKGQTGRQGLIAQLK